MLKYITMYQHSNDTSFKCMQC